MPKKWFEIDDDAALPLGEVSEMRDKLRMGHREPQPYATPSRVGHRIRS